MTYAYDKLCASNMVISTVLVQILEGDRFRFMMQGLCWRSYQKGDHCVKQASVAVLLNYLVGCLFWLWMQKYVLFLGEGRNM